MVGTVHIQFGDVELISEDRKPLSERLWDGSVMDRIGGTCEVGLGWGAPPMPGN